MTYTTDTLQYKFEGFSKLDLSVAEVASDLLLTDPISIVMEYGKTLSSIEDIGFQWAKECHDETGCDEVIGHLTFLAFTFGVYVATTDTFVKIK